MEGQRRFWLTLKALFSTSSSLMRTRRGTWFSSSSSMSRLRNGENVEHSVATEYGVIGSIISRFKFVHLKYFKNETAINNHQLQELLVSFNHLDGLIVHVFQILHHFLWSIYVVLERGCWCLDEVKERSLLLLLHWLQVVLIVMVRTEWYCLRLARLVV